MIVKQNEGFVKKYFHEMGDLKIATFFATLFEFRHIAQI